MEVASAQRERPRAVTVPPRLAALRGASLGAAVLLLIIQFGLGLGVNLYVTLPGRESFLSQVFGSATLAAHAIVAVVLLENVDRRPGPGHARPRGRWRVHLGRAGGDSRGLGRRGIVRGQREQRRLARHGPGHRRRHVLLPRR